MFDYIKLKKGVIGYCGVSIDRLSPFDPLTIRRGKRKSDEELLIKLLTAARTASQNKVGIVAVQSIRKSTGLTPYIIKRWIGLLEIFSRFPDIRVFKDGTGKCYLVSIPYSVIEPFITAEIVKKTQMMYDGRISIGGEEITVESKV